jgi:hypothetical protein
MRKIFNPKYLYYLFVIILLIVDSCEYKPEGNYEVDVKQITDSPNIEVNLNFNTDTIYLPTTSYVNFKYSVNDSLARYAIFLINGQQISKLESSSGSFNFDFNSSLYKIDNPYKLTLEIFRSTGSGSLADILETEGFLYKKDFIMIFKNDSEMSPNITKLVAENGSLKIVWDIFKGVGLKYYHVFDGPDYKPAVISDQMRTYCFDSSFIGYGSFYIITETDYGEYKSPSVSFSDIDLTVEGTKLENGKVKLNWVKTRYPTNLAGYRIYRFVQENSELKKITFLTDSQDSSYDVDLNLFGVKSKYYVKHVAKVNHIPEDENNVDQYAGSTDYFTSGGKIPAINWMVFDKSLDKYCYFRHDYVVYKYDSESQTIKDSIQYVQYRESLSPDGNKLIIGSSDQLEILDTKTMSPNYIIPASALPLGEIPVQFVISNSDTGVIVTGSGKFCFYDFQNKSSISDFSIYFTTPAEDRMKISSNGHFFYERHATPFYNYFTTDLFKLDGNTVSKIWSAAINYSEFDPNNNTFIYFSNNTLYTISLNDLSTVKALSINDPYIFDIDWSRKEFLSLNSSQDKFSICDLVTGTIKATVETASFNNSWTNKSVYLFNKTLFYQDIAFQIDY